MHTKNKCWCLKPAPFEILDSILRCGWWNRGSVHLKYQTNTKQIPAQKLESPSWTCLHSRTSSWTMRQLTHARSFLTRRTWHLRGRTTDVLAIPFKCTDFVDLSLFALFQQWYVSTSLITTKSGNISGVKVSSPPPSALLVEAIVIRYVRRPTKISLQQKYDYDFSTETFFNAFLSSTLSSLIPSPTGVALCLGKMYLINK